MKLVSAMFSLVDRFCVVVGAFIGSQIPTFMQQYTQRLAGHVDELQHLLHQIGQMASQSGKSLEQYVQKFLSNSDPEFVQHGNFIQNIFSRWEELQQSLFSLTNSPMWLKPYTFFMGLQYDIAHSTLDFFQPGFNLGMEGMCYAGIGGLVGWALYHIVSITLRFGISRVLVFGKSSL